MAETAKHPVEAELGCSFIGAIFPRRSLWLRKSSGKSLPTERNKGVFNSSKLAKARPKPVEKPTVPKPSEVRPRFLDNRNHQTRPSDAGTGRTSTSTSSSSSGHQRKASGVLDLSRLSLTMANPRKSITDASIHHRTSSLGQMKQQQGTKVSSVVNNKVGVGGDLVMGNIVRRSSFESPRFGKILSGIVKKLDPEVLKTQGNERYREGKFEQALGLYEQAIGLDPNRACYHSNRGAALIGLGRLVEAVLACKDAVRIEPSYQRAHYRLATLYLRLGEVEKAMDHYKLSGLKSDSEVIARAEVLKTHIAKCTEARALRDWNTLLKETQAAMSYGADSAPLIHAMQIDALFELRKHQQAYSTFQKAPTFDADSCTQLFGPASFAYLLAIRARAYLLAGRFEEAVAAIQQAAKLDLSNEINEVLTKAQAMALARSKGNQLFRGSKFLEACCSYSEGLEHDPYNPVILCNRAACRFKLGLFEKAAEDCTLALNVRPNYSKARLRRAHCNAKMERWEAAIQDYEMLIREAPGQEEVTKALVEAQVQLKRQKIEDTKAMMKLTSNLITIPSNKTSDSTP